jgi:hypothetical protein
VATVLDFDLKKRGGGGCNLKLSVTLPYIIVFVIEGLKYFLDIHMIVGLVIE